MINAMRDLSQRYALDDEAMHWRCIWMMRATLEITQEIFPRWNVVSSSMALRQLMDSPAAPGGASF